MDLNKFNFEPVDKKLVVAAHSGCVDLNGSIGGVASGEIGRSPLRLRGFKSGLPNISAQLNSRSPLGLRGFKSTQMFYINPRAVSQPTRAAWIEIWPQVGQFLLPWSQPTRAAWIEIIMSGRSGIMLISRSPFGLRGLK